MSWARVAKEALRRGETVQVRPRGHSMVPRVRSGATVTLEPCAASAVRVDDVVLVRVRGTDYLHLVKAVDRERFLIGNNRGGINGWVRGDAIYGRATRIEN